MKQGYFQDPDDAGRMRYYFLTPGPPAPRSCNTCNGHISSCVKSPSATVTWSSQIQAESPPSASSLKNTGYKVEIKGIFRYREERSSRLCVRTDTASFRRAGPSYTVWPHRYQQQRVERSSSMKPGFPVICIKKYIYQSYNVIPQVDQEQCNRITIRPPYLYLNYVLSYVIT